MHLTRLALSVPIAILLSGGPAPAQDWSPLVERTGRGPLDQYRNTVHCSAVFEQALDTALPDVQRVRLEQGIEYALNFSLFVLESGSVVDETGTILGPAVLPASRHLARETWLVALDSGAPPGLEGAEIARCLRLYGHAWE